MDEQYVYHEYVYMYIIGMKTLRVSKADLDWFKRTITGHPYTWWGKLRFPVIGPFNKSSSALNTIVYTNEYPPSHFVVQGGPLRSDKLVYNHRQLQLYPRYPFVNVQFRPPTVLNGMK